MKVTFVNPNHNWNTSAEAYGSKSYLKVRKITPPLGLGYLAALIRDDHDVEIIEANALDLSREFVIDCIKDRKPDVTAITSMYPSTKHVISLAKQLRPYTGTLITGGADPSVRINDYLEAFDVVNRGQGEMSFKKFIDGETFESIRGLAYNKNGTRCDSPEMADMIDNLDDMPFIPWDLLPIGKYKPATMNIKYSYPSAVLMTSRGCPYHCAYCATNTVAQKFQMRSIENVMEEIHYVKKKYNITHVEFFDDTFTFDRERVVSLCEEFISNDLKLRWCCVTRPDKVDEKILKLMKKAGCYFILFGVQSVDPLILKNVNRSATQETVRRAIQYAKNAGIMVRLDFILGLPGSNEETMERSFKFIEETAPDIVDFYPVLWLPGTILAQNYKVQYDDSYLESIATSFYKRFYLKLSYFFQILSHCTRIEYLYRLFQCFLALFLAVLSKKESCACCYEPKDQKSHS
ncbi:B12-binding domain-containing radical SAM protein [Candidatus Omnitrophota bacterium]